MLRPTLAILALAAFAGCMTPADLAASSTSPEPGAPDAADLTQTLALEGLTPAYAEMCAWTPVAGRCAAGPPTADFSKVRLAPDVNGTPTAFSVTFTWNAATPANEEMTAFATIIGEDFAKSVAWKMGGSPLELSADEIDLGEGGELYLGLAGRVAGQGADAGGVTGSANPADQPWKLDGTITLAAPETMPAP